MMFGKQSIGVATGPVGSGVGCGRWLGLLATLAFSLSLALGEAPSWAADGRLDLKACVAKALAQAPELGEIRTDISRVPPAGSFGKISQAVAAAKNGIEVETARQEQQRNEIVVQVKQFYYGVLLARDARALLNGVRSDLALAREKARTLQDHNSSNVEDADLSTLDSFTVEIGRYLVEAINGERLALSALKGRLGLAPDAVLELEEQRLTRVVETMETLDAYLDRAKFSTSRGPEEFNSLEGEMPLGETWQFDFGSTGVGIAPEQGRHGRLTSVASLAEENIPQLIMKHYDQGVEAAISIDATRSGYEESRQRAATAFANFDFGIGPATDIFLALQQYARLRWAHCQSIYNYNLALANLSYAVGDEPL
jgi:outer membrane protein